MTDLFTDYDAQIAPLLDRLDEAKLDKREDVVAIINQELDRLNMERELTEGDERSLIRALLTLPHDREDALELVTKADFHNALDGTLCEVIRVLVHRGCPLTQDSFLHELTQTRHNPLDDADTRSVAEVLGWGERGGWGKRQIVELFSEPPHNAVYYAHRVRERAVRRLAE